MRSNTYTLIFTATITIILGLLLSLAATSLKDRQALNIELDIKKNILIALDIESDGEKYNSDEIQKKYDQLVHPIVINEKGTVLDGITPENIDKPLKQFPVYVQQNDDGVGGYAIPISGKGLWSTVYGYLALENDGETVKGITFYQHGETPGLGGEIEKEWFTDNYKKKKIVNEMGELVSVQSVKGLADPTSPEFYHQVDGVSGATMTTKGLNEFLEKDLHRYNPYFKMVRGK